MESEQEDLKSPEVQEILGIMPPRLIRWGITIIFFAVITLLTTSWSVRYPDLVKAEVLITPSPPPNILISVANGNLILLCKENEVVQKGQLLAYIQSSASIDAILLAEKNVKNGRVVGSEIHLGTLGYLEPYYNALILSLTSLNSFKKNIYDKQISQLTYHSIPLLKLERSLLSQEKLMDKELKLWHKKFDTDYEEFSQAGDSMIFNKTKTDWWLQHQSNAYSIQSCLLTIRVQINELNKKMADLEIQKMEKNEKLEFEARQNKDRFLAEIKKWKENYTFFAPSSGRLTFFGVLSNKQFIEANTSLFSILPKHAEWIAKAELSANDTRKLKVGQQATVVLDNNFIDQPGLLYGQVLSISFLPTTNTYGVIIALPDPPQDTAQKGRHFRHQLHGTTEITTENSRLLERFILQLKRAYSR